MVEVKTFDITGDISPERLKVEKTALEEQWVKIPTHQKLEKKWTTYVFSEDPQKTIRDINREAENLKRRPKLDLENNPFDRASKKLLERYVDLINKKPEDSPRTKDLFQKFYELANTAWKVADRVIREFRGKIEDFAKSRAEEWRLKAQSSSIDNRYFRERLQEEKAIMDELDKSYKLYLELVKRRDKLTVKEMKESPYLYQQYQEAISQTEDDISGSHTLLKEIGDFLDESMMKEQEDLLKIKQLKKYNLNLLEGIKSEKPAKDMVNYNAKRNKNESFDNWKISIEVRKNELYNQLMNMFNHIGIKDQELLEYLVSEGAAQNTIKQTFQLIDSRILDIVDERKKSNEHTNQLVRLVNDTKVKLEVLQFLYNKEQEEAIAKYQLDQNEELARAQRIDNLEEKDKGLLAKVREFIKRS